MGFYEGFYREVQCRVSDRNILRGRKYWCGIRQNPG